MCLMLNVEDLVANALIEIIERKNENYVSLEKLELYREKIIEKFENQEKEEVLLSISNSEIDRFVDVYPSFFAFEGDTIYLKKGKNSFDLRQYFRSYLPLNVTKVFCDTAVLQPLLVG